MISKRILKEELGLNSIDEYFDLISEAYERGDMVSVHSKFMSLSVPHKKQCIKYFERYDEAFVSKLNYFFNPSKYKRNKTRQ